jgi:hypothetical protein
MLLLATTERDCGSMSGLMYSDDFTAQLDAIIKLGRDTPWQEIITLVDSVLQGRIMVWPGTLVQAQDRHLREINPFGRYQTHAHVGDLCA